MIKFTEKPYVETRGYGGRYEYKVFGEAPPPPIQPVTPLDTERFPLELHGFAAEPLEGKATGASTSYVGSVYAKPWLSQPAKKLGMAFSGFGLSVSSFSDYEVGSLAIGYSNDSESRGTQALNVWVSEEAISVSDANDIINDYVVEILYELFEDDGSVWRPVYNADWGSTGYYNAEDDIFFELYFDYEEQT